MSKKAFVTGATGFIGINLIRLLLDRGWDVTALHRSSSDLSRLKPLSVRLKEGSITDATTVERALPTDTDAVFHLAGSTNLWSKRNAQQTAVNVGGSRNMIEAAVRKEVPVVVHTSSVAAWGDASGLITEETPQQGGDSWVNYERTKWAGEREVLKGTEHGVKVVILNPAHVTGPYDTNNWGRLFFALRDGDLPGIPAGEASITHVEEVAKAHLAAVDKGRSGERYILAGNDYTFYQFVSEVARVSGIDELPSRVPDFIFKAVAHLSVLKAAITNKTPDVTPELAHIMTRSNLSYSNEKAIRELDYRLVPMEQSVRDCYEWLKQEGLL
ncbi:MAG: SDR family oxidoreductase [Balneolaceae bacterium]|nr:SDR family oxidoreductase [Balneolaceae bacterium]